MAVNEVNRPLVILFGLVLIAGVAFVVAGEAKASPCKDGRCNLPPAAKRVVTKTTEVARSACKNGVCPGARESVRRCCPPKAKGIVRRVLGRVGR